MRIPRRRFLHLVAGAAALPATARLAVAQAYPSRPLRFVVGFPPGGGADIVSRIVAQWLSERLGQPVVVENRPGAASNISIQHVVGSPPDGYTLLFVAASAAVNVSLFDNLSFDLLRDVAPVAGLIDFPLVMVANPSFPAKTVGELIAYAKARPGEVSLASFGAGSTSHVAGELFKMMAGIDMIHVPYRGGGPALTDLLGGQVQVYFGNMVSSVEYIKAGTLRALAITTTTRSQALPDLPPMADFVPGYEASSWFGIGAPKSTAPEIIDRLNKEINTGLADPKLAARLADLGGTVLALLPADFGKLIADETEKWAKVIRFAGIRPE
jgi:tripartite-type tricarboxylate transporter receptor subunit TctC